MSDIVKRLRAESKDWRENIGPMPLFDEAAERIESVQAELAEARAVIEQVRAWHDSLTGPVNLFQLRKLGAILDEYGENNG
jgi:hypothetical protein